ncbi:MAG TPA: sulfate transporter CysZ [Thiotrichaceae bacterium]|jgi:CysZ protein|nr:sulfate transporter CysZ [Thiotrichaceae bacterium]HIM08609.1 sulfate transporter CysZ [Gammaproteobacteria bacterium]
MKQFTQGFKYLLSGFKLILKPGIRSYVIIPLLINSVLFAGAIVYGANSLNNLINSLLEQWQWLEWLTWLLWPIFVIIALAIVFFCFSIIANLVGAPFNGFLAAAVERTITSQELQPENEQELLEVIIISIKSEFQKLLYFAIRAIPLLVLFIIPMVHVAAPLIWFLFTAWMLTLEYGDYPMGNHDILFKQQREKFSKNRQLAFGFGSGVMLLTMIPVVNFLAMPVAVAGATRMFIEHSGLKTEGTSN